MPMPIPPATFSCLSIDSVTALEQPCWKSKREERCDNYTKCIFRIQSLGRFRRRVFDGPRERLERGRPAISSITWGDLARHTIKALDIFWDGRISDLRTLKDFYSKNLWSPCVITDEGQIFICTLIMDGFRGIGILAVKKQGLLSGKTLSKTEEKLLHS